MLGKADQILLLLRKHLSGKITDPEKVTLDEWVKSSEAAQKLYNEFTDPEVLDREFSIYLENVGEDADDDLKRLFESSLPETKVIHLGKTKISRYWWIAAASIIFIVTTASYFTLFNKSENGQVVKVQPIVQDVLPGTFKAKLTLDDGSTIILDKASKGEITKQGNAVVSSQDGQLVYSAPPNTLTIQTLYNTLFTSRGEMYPAVLSDGSKIWLNSETKIRFPATFNEKERVIELITGEIYLEVSHVINAPFKVHLKDCEIEVLGTKFGIRAFKDEPYSRTSLLSGKIKLTSFTGNSMVLSPGDQAKISLGGMLSLEKNADVQGSVAWVYGIFHFEEANIQYVLNELARWYNVEVEFRGNVTTDRIYGDMEKNIPLSVVLKNLEQLTKTTFKIEQSKIIVNP
jgi:ferric-dicitrate binding protein FerR (iron transport regulator)